MSPLLGFVIRPQHTEALRAHDGLRARFGRKLLKDALQMGLDGFRRDPQLAGDLLVRMAPGNPLDDGTLAFRKIVT